MTESYKNKEVEFYQIFDALKKHIVMIALSFILTVVVVYSATLLMKDHYEAYAIVAGADSDSSSSIGNIAGQLGGLASFAGLNLTGTQKVDETQLALEIMKSRQFIIQFIEQRNLLADIVAIEDWNSEGITYSGIYDKSSGAWIEGKPSLLMAYSKFTDNLSIEPSETAGVYKIRYYHLSPELAKNIVNWLIVDINKEIKNKNRSEAQRGIDFLKSQLNKTDLFEIKSVIYKLIEEQQKKLMFSEVNEEVALEVVDPAIKPESTSYPKRLIIVFICSILILLVACLIAVFKECIPRSVK